METFELPIIITGTYSIEAETLQEAIEKLPDEFDENSENFTLENTSLDEQYLKEKLGDSNGN